MERVLSNLCNLLRQDPSRVFYCWTGTSYSDDNILIRLDKLYLNALYTDAKENYVFRRLFGCLVFDSFGEPYIWFSPGSVRITSGNRRGKLLPFTGIQPDERFVQAGLHKVLQTGLDSKYFSSARTGDVQLVELFQLLQDPVKQTTIIHPQFFLTRKGAAQLRNNGIAAQYLQTHIRYNSDTDLATNIDNMKDSLLQLSEERVAWPFEYFHGKGVTAADTKLLNQWFSTSIPEITEPYIQIRILT